MAARQVGVNMVLAIWEGLQQQPWYMRAVIGAVVGAFLFIVVPAITTLKPPGGQGGRGGNASVGGSGIAIGGLGGHAGEGGRGGDGGSAQVAGDGIAAGGQGGGAGSVGIWRAPAKSGYELAQRAQGLPVDPELRKYGRGGAQPGYESKLAHVEKLRAEYFAKVQRPPQTIFENINAMPLADLNAAIASSGEKWLARIVDDEYEFYMPR